MTVEMARGKQYSWPSHIRRELIGTSGNLMRHLGNWQGIMGLEL